VPGQEAKWAQIETQNILFEHQETLFFLLWALAQVVRGSCGVFLLGDISKVVWI